MQELWHSIVDWITVIHIYDRYCKQIFTYLLRKSQRMSCQHLKSQSEFTKNSELPFWIFCMLTTWLRYNLDTAKHLCALPLITLTSAKIFTTRWSFGHALFSTLKIVWTFLLCCYAFFYLYFFKKLLTNSNRFIVLFYRQFRLCITRLRAKPIPLNKARTCPKAPSGRELSAKLTEGECDTRKTDLSPIPAGSFHRWRGPPPSWREAW